MPNKAISVGFVGTDSYDLLMYLAIMLTVSGKKTLLVDNSCHKALFCCIPVSDRITGMEKEVCYKGMAVRKDTLLDSLEGGYDYILADFGQNLKHKDIKYCTTVFLVTDTGLHNMAAIESFCAAMSNMYVLIRDIPCGMNEKCILKLLNEKGIMGKKSYYFYFDEADREAMAALQYYNNFHYKKLSPAIHHFLKEILPEVFGIEEKQLKLTEKKLKRRRKNACGFLEPC